MFPFSSLLTAISAGLQLNALNSAGVALDPANAAAALRLLRLGDVQELSGNDTYTSQNPDFEWISASAKTASIGDAYEVMLTGTGDTPDADGYDLDTWYTIDTTITFRFVQTVIGVKSFTGTMTVREIAAPANSVSAAATMTATVNNPA